MTRSKTPSQPPDLLPLDAFLAEQDDSDDLSIVAESLGEITPPPALLSRVLASAGDRGRFDRFAGGVAELLDVSMDRARALLDSLSSPAAWEPGFTRGMELLHVQGGPQVADAITGFVRVEAGLVFPEHEHLGGEAVLIVAGRCEDAGRIHQPGDLVRMPAGSRHSFRVCPGPDLVYLAVVQRGLRIGDRVLSATDPNA